MAQSNALGQRNVLIIESFIDLSEQKCAPEEVERLNTDLEQKVLQRIQELDLANEHLRKAMQQLVQPKKLVALGRVVASAPKNHLREPVEIVNRLLRTQHAMDPTSTQRRSCTRAKGGHRVAVETLSSVCMDSSPANGGRFHFTLPLRSPEHKALCQDVNGFL